MLNNLEQYADQCTADRLRKQIETDYLTFMEIVESDEDIQEVLKAVQHA